jgi:glycosyltransferase involved in cell wall biosynthesis
VKLAIVAQRYGADISGGAELHARYIAERLAAHADVRVFTTCAKDYVTWRNELPAGEDLVNGIRVTRFPVVRERDLDEFGRRSTLVFTRHHSLEDELRWLESEGPLSPALVGALRAARHDFDYALFFSIRYYQAFHGARAVSDRAVLVPTAERDPALGLGMFGPVFRGARAIMYNSFEERALIQAVSGNHDVPGVVVGVGSEIPTDVSAERFRRAYGVREPFLVYIGRIDANKGCAELFDFFRKYTDSASSPRPASLLLIGTPVLPIPKDPRIRHLGYVSDRDKFDAIAASEALVMPSYYESLSMVALEAWALGKPVVANARCDVLLGQCLRSNGGLYYRDAAEFAGVLDAILENRTLAATLGRSGREYFVRHYAWPVIERKYLEMFARLDAETAGGAAPRAIEVLPGWWARHRRVMPPAAQVLESLPSGAALGPTRQGQRSQVTGQT